jgi:NAD(P)H-hydrate epimerase
MRYYPSFIASPSESKKLDQLASEKFGVPSLILMENAARSVLYHASVVWPDLLNRSQKIFILGGPGQNGGDGWVLARLLSTLGHRVEGYLISKPGLFPSGDSLVNFNIAKSLGVTINVIDRETDVLPDWSAADLIVDAVFGTGLDRPLEEVPLRVLSSVRESKRLFRVLAVDLPSGLSGEDGELLGPVLPADMTVSLGTLKQGLFLGEGPNYSGLVRLGDIGLCPPMFREFAPLGLFLDKQEARELVPQRPRAAHKGVFGHAFLAGASPGKTGALVLAATGALRAGCGLVTACHPQSLSAVMETKLTAPMTRGLPQTEEGLLNKHAARALISLLSFADSLCLGPGMGATEDTREFVLTLLSEVKIPLLLDADALSVLNYSIDDIRARKYPTVLTPHPGEAATLLGSDPSVIQRKRLEAARSLSEDTGAVIVLKGLHTIVMEPRGKRFYINATGGPILATGGSGDLLAGLITGFLAQKMEPFHAAALGVYLHGSAADLCGAELGPSGVSPTEIQTYIPKAVKALELMEF